MGTQQEPEAGPGPPSINPEDIHVLLVDDERLSRTVVASLLRKCNYKGARKDRACRLRKTIKDVLKSRKKFA